jgi:toxin ParE1/3/4
VSKYKLTPAAREHLIGIWNYSVEQWGIAQAEKYLLNIEDSLIQLGKNPRGLVLSMIHRESI